MMKSDADKNIIALRPYPTEDGQTLWSHLNTLGLKLFAWNIFIIFVFIHSSLEQQPSNEKQTGLLNTSFLAY